jgi:topoisomerase-4 subunit B
VIEPLVLRKARRRAQAGHHGARLARRQVLRIAELPHAELVHLLRSKAVLMPGVTVTLTTRRRRKTRRPGSTRAACATT